ncbi:unnamed protein product [Allacma fusca]|uniref:VWFA domain-containing protein n=1 Tax=Allacma fusca TaxID=39272 RepID=A0A8J2LPV1_9HEXA|nr:unnamed protein product [Allacma fusca]
MVAFLRIVTLAIIICVNLTSCQIDKSIQDDSKGKEVVDVVISKIGNLFGQDHGFFKRLAYVNEEFGTKRTANNFIGGIWHVTQDMYEITKTDSLRELHAKISNEFGISWVQTSWTDLKKPLYSALALHLFLYSKDPASLNNGYPRNLEDQANYRSQYLLQGVGITSPNQTEFKRMVTEFELKKHCNAKVDLVVVLDGSNKVSPRDFQTSLQFVAELFQRYSPKTSRLGLVVFSTQVQTHIVLDSAKDASQIQSIVASIPFPNGESNINCGIQAALTLFHNAAPKQGVPQVLVFLTYGETNPDDALGMSQVESEEISTYVVGIGSQPKSPVLLQLALMDPQRVFDFSSNISPNHLASNIHQQTCFEPQTLSPGEYVSDILTNDVSGLFGAAGTVLPTMAPTSGSTSHDPQQTDVVDTRSSITTKSTLTTDNNENEDITSTTTTFKSRPETGTEPIAATNVYAPSTPTTTPEVKNQVLDPAPVSHSGSFGIPGTGSSVVGCWRIFAIVPILTWSLF